MAGSMEFRRVRFRPLPLPPGVHPQFQFGNHFGNHGPRRRFVTHRDHGNIFVPVPVFYPIYGYGDPAYPVADPYIQGAQDSAADSSTSASSTVAPVAAHDHELQAAYLQGARDALAHERDSARYGDHYMDSRERVRSRKEESPAPPAAVEEPTPQPARENNSPKRFSSLKMVIRLKHATSRLSGKRFMIFLTAA